MLHLSPETGKWVTCLVGDDEKCELEYHAPVKEGEVADSLLWEMYASEELTSNPSTDHWGSYWFDDLGAPHRLYDLPAKVKSYRKEWWVHGKLHRLNGPAVEWSDGRKEWWVNGKQAKSSFTIR